MEVPMPYVRKRGNQVAIVHGERERETGKVQQRILFAFYSKDEAREALGKGGAEGERQFRSLLEHQYPAIRFDWKKLKREIEKNLGVLPEEYPYRETRLQGRFRTDLRAFLRQLVLTDPQSLFPSAEVIEEHRHELEFLVDLVRWRLETRKVREKRWNADNRFFWRFELQGGDVPSEAEEFAVGYFERGDLERAEAAFRLLIECFDGYADGHNYLGTIAEERGDLQEAVQHYRRAVETGRHLFPRRTGKKREWSNLKCRPYMRGLKHLARILNYAGRYEEALALCLRIESECGDDLGAIDQRSLIVLNLGRYEEAADSALYANGLFPEASLTAAFALHELGHKEEALAWFLHGAINSPRAARALAGLSSPRPGSSEEAEDHNMGIHLSKSLHRYLEDHPASRRFHRRILRAPQVDAILDESEQVVRRRRHQAPKGTREAFDRMTEMRKPEYARERASELFPLFFPREGAKAGR
jgi:tetratricopeptide (TPR) repeat protein